MCRGTKSEKEGDMARLSSFPQVTTRRSSRRGIRAGKLSSLSNISCGLLEVESASMLGLSKLVQRPPECDSFQQSFPGSDSLNSELFLALNVKWAVCFQSMEIMREILRPVFAKNRREIFDGMLSIPYSSQHT